MGPSLIQAKIQNETIRTRRIVEQQLALSSTYYELILTVVVYRGQIGQVQE